MSDQNELLLELCRVAGKLEGAGFGKVQIGVDDEGFFIGLLGCVIAQSQKLREEMHLAVQTGKAEGSGVVS